MWVELLRSGKKSRIPDEVLMRLATCGPIVQEVLQGLKPEPASEAFRAAFAAVPVLSDPIPLRLFEAAADIFRQGRRRGYTVRSSTDCLIAAIAIDNGVPVWHRDRDFDSIAEYTLLETVRALPR